MEQNHLFAAHATEESLEAYAMNRLSEAEAETFEEHLLVCDGCQVRLESWDNYLIAMRAALEKAQREPVKAGIGETVRGWFRMPLRTWALAAPVALALLVVAGIEIPRRGSSAGETVRLEAKRGEGAHVRAHRGLNLDLSTEGLPTLSTFGVEIVNAAGDTVIKKDARPHGNTVSIAVPGTLNAGNYFVRLYGAEADPLREFALHVD